VYKHNFKKASILFIISVVLAIVLFCFVGSALAYFQIETLISGQYKIGSLGASWYNGATQLTEDAEFTLTDIRLKRGNPDGTYIKKINGDEGGVINIRGDADSADQYVRVKATATVDGDDVTEYLTFKYIDNDQDIDYVIGEDVWPLGDDGWYYYSDDLVRAEEFVAFCNNIVLSKDYPAEYTNKEMTITFEFETLQYANNPLDVWGDDAETLLGDL